MSASSRATALRNTTHDFCNALVSPPPPADLLARFFTKNSPKITEHGPEWAQSRLPFLGKTFSGREGCLSYFRFLNDTLAMKLPSDAFPSQNSFMVDVAADVVSVVGKGRFKCKKTGKGWDEEFIYRFSGFDGEGKIGHWEIWADPLSAWAAVGGTWEDGDSEGVEGTGGEGQKGEGILEGAGYAS